MLICNMLVIVVFYLIRPIHERRDILKKNVTEIKNHIILSEMTHITVSTLSLNTVFLFFMESLSILVSGSRDLIPLVKPAQA